MNLGQFLVTTKGFSFFFERAKKAKEVSHIATAVPAASFPRSASVRNKKYM